MEYHFHLRREENWLPFWGEKPKTREKSLQKLKELLTSAPTLIPVYGHRFMPDSPNSIGNPIFSVRGLDIIPYGFDLFDYPK